MWVRRVQVGVVNDFHNAVIDKMDKKHILTSLRDTKRRFDLQYLK